MRRAWTDTMLQTYYPRYARALQAAARERWWIGWHYAPDEWAKLDYELWKQDLRRATTHAVAGAALAALLFMGSALAFAGISNRLLGWGLVAIVVGLTLVTVGAHIRYIYCRAQAAHLRRQRGPAEISIGPLAVRLPGQTLPLAGYSVAPSPDAQDPLAAGMDVLEDVQVEQAEPLRIRFVGFPITSKGGPARRQVIVLPVPRGREEEARRLAARFHSEILDSST